MRWGIPFFRLDSEDKEKIFLLLVILFIYKYLNLHFHNIESPHAPEMIAPPKKRRLARESLSSEQSFTPPTTPTRPNSLNVMVSKIFNTRFIHVIEVHKIIYIQ